MNSISSSRQECKAYPLKCRTGTLKTHFLLARKQIGNIQGLYYRQVIWMLRFLIVEDERSISDFIGRGLKDAGYRADFAYDGLSAADMIDREVYDLILLDTRIDTT